MRSNSSIADRISLFLLSAAGLLFELHLSRLFSVAQFYHFAFMIVSLALLGFGASGAFLAIFPHFGSQNPSRTLRILALGAALSIWGAYFLTNELPFDSFSIAWDWRQSLILALHYVALSLPFFFNGAAVGLLLNASPEKVGSIYAFNLAGSALGGLGALIAPQLVGGEGVVLLCSSLAALAGSVPSWRSPRQPILPIYALAGAIATLNLLAIAWQVVHVAPLPFLALRLSPYKGLSYALQVPGAEIIYQRWNAFSRIDLVRSPAIRSLPGVSLRYPASPPPEYGLFRDGDDLNPVVLPGADPAYTDYLLTTLPFELRPAAQALLVEPGGGLDVLTAFHQGAAQITTVELNPLVIQAAAPIYTLPKVRVIQETGRSYLRRSQEKFDIILFSLTSSYHPIRSGAYSLTEDYRYTRQAFQDALNRLGENGILAAPRWLQTPPSEFLRVFVLAVSTLRQYNLEPATRIAAIRSFNLGLLLIKKTPFTAQELSQIRRFSAERAFDLVYLPDIKPEETNRYNILPESIYFQTFTSFLQAPSPETWLADYPYDVTPPTDDHPFFSHYFKWSQATQMISELGKVWQPFGGAGYFVLLTLLLLALILAALIIVLPLALTHRIRLEQPATMACLIYFGALGLAFLLVEIPLVQHFILYLGHPAYAFTIVLSSLLVFSSLGSLSVRRLPRRAVLMGLAALILLEPLLLPWIFEHTLGYSLPLRGLLTLFMLAPLGFLMGIPFPNGIHQLRRVDATLIPWAWGINGALSVIASILAALMALSLGFRWSLIVGAACYIIAWATLPRLTAQAAPLLPE